MKVLLWGPISPKGEPSKGGYEATNRKIFDGLKDRGVEVESKAFFPNRSTNYVHKFLCYMALFFRPISLFKYIGTKNVVLQISPPGGYLMYPSAVIVFFANLFNIPTVVHIMAGTFFLYYERKGPVYRWVINLLIRNASAVAVEGRPYINQIKERIGYNGRIIYLPTMVDCRNLPYHEVNTSGPYNLFYFGRLNKAKGVYTMLEVINLLDDRYHLFLDGFLSNDIDLERLNCDKVTYLGVESKEQLRETMKDMTFFIFPTTHEGEGQANSLIEAMAFGLIPITSDKGFCSDVVGDCGVVLPVSSTAQDYRDAIVNLSNEDIKALSEKCQERIKTNHNIVLEVQKLFELLSDIARE